MASEQAIIRNYAKTGIVLDELAIPNRSAQVENPSMDLRDADDKSVGYAKPLIFINGYFVERFLLDFNLDLNQILPTIRVKFYTGDPSFLNINYPKDGDIISIYIRSNVTVYKPVRMDFSILSVDSNLSTSPEGSLIIFSILGECRIPGFYTEVCKAYRGKTSYQTLLDVSQELDLGFATNDPNLEDRMTWICPNISYYNFIKEVTLSSYKDDRSFYASWVDLYYNLNFVNINNQLEAEDVIQNARIIPGSSRGQANDTLFPGIELIPADIPIMVTNDPQQLGYPLFMYSYTLLSESGNTTNQMGYIQEIQLYNENFQYDDSPEEKYVKYTIESTTTENVTENMVLQRGRASEKEYLKEVRKKWMGILFSGQEGQVHPNYLQARAQNPLNLADVTKFILRVETRSYFAGIYRGQVIPVVVYVTEKGPRMENTGVSQNQLLQSQKAVVQDQFLSGKYVLMGYSVCWSESKGFYQILNLCKREWILNSAGKSIPKAFPINLVSNPGGSNPNPEPTRRSII
jgi:hypothetical protein